MIRLRARSSAVRRAPRRGFALVLVLGVLTVLVTLLVAAQGSVMTSHRQTKLAEGRSERALLVARVLGEIERRVLEGTPGDALAPVEIAESGAVVRGSYKAAAPDNPIYAENPALAHRPGDALATISVADRGVAETMLFVLNGQGNRRGAVRVQ